MRNVVSHIQSVCWAATLLASSLVAGCVAQFDESLGDEDVAEAQQPSFILSSSAWNAYLNIPVCWETAGSATEKSWVRSTVESRFEGQPFFHVNFTGWDTCVASPKGIRIQISDTGPHVKALGRGLDGMINGMVLNFTFANWSQLGCSTAWVGEAGRRHCIEAIAMHEFGHALGLAHEQNRADKPASCPDAPQGTNGDVFVGNFDQGSLMSYCNPTWNNGGLLSEGDVAGLARLYGGGGDVFVGASSGGGFASGVPRHDGFCHGKQCMSGDFNGDGKADIVNFSNLFGEVYVALSTGSGFASSWEWHSDFLYGYYDIPAVGDFNGDGRDDIVTFTRGSEGNVYVALSTGSGFGASQLWHTDFSYYDEIPVVGDFNGDGRDDIVTFTRGSRGDVYVALSTGSWFNGSGWLWHSDFSFYDEIPAVGDFNGDGKDDIVTFTHGNRGDVYVALSDGTWFNGWGWLWHSDFSFHDEIPVIGDINFDGKGDIVTFARGNQGNVFAAVSNGSSFVGTTWKWASGICLQQDVCSLGDVTGDGRADAIGFKPFPAIN